jgi:dUTP pyrophosphatase
MEKVKYELLNEGAQPPVRKNEGDCYDLVLPTPVVVTPTPQLVKLGIKFDIPSGYGLRIYPRSSLALKKNVCVSNGVGIIDTKYKDEVGIILNTFSGEYVKLEAGERIAQIELVKLYPIDWEQGVVGGENRGGGFGSTGGYK